jgi:acyl-CoA thioester hydrolase
MVDFNAHMKNTAYLDIAADTRMFYFASKGFPMREFERLKIGPVVLRESIVYRRELRLLEMLEVMLECSGMSNDGARFNLRNTFFRPDGKVAAVVTSEAAWLDTVNRSLAVPPELLCTAIGQLARTDGFRELRARMKMPPEG